MSVLPIENWKEFQRNLTKGLILQALKRSNGNQAQAALILGMSRTTLVMKMKVLKISIIHLKVTGVLK
jgi:DNA-binding NtrC family response regulator